MNNYNMPGTIAICKLTYHFKKEITLEELKRFELISLTAFNDAFALREIKSHITSSSLKVGSIIIEASIWVGGIISFLKMYPSVRKGLLELIEDAKRIIYKMLGEHFSRECVEIVPQADIISIVEKMPKYDEIIIMGMDLHQLYALSTSNKSHVQDVKYLFIKYSKLSDKLAINLDSILCKLLKSDADGLSEARNFLAKFGQKYEDVFQLGVQIMNFNNAIMICYDTRQYEVVDKVSKQVIEFMNKLNFSEEITNEVIHINESIKELMLLSSDELEKKTKHILEKLMNISIRNLE